MPVSHFDGTQHEVSFQDYTGQVEGMLGKYMMTFVQHLVKQKWGEVRHGASSLPLSNAEALRDAPKGIIGTSGLLHPAISAEDNLHMSSSARKAIPDFWSLINAQDGMSSLPLHNVERPRNTQEEVTGSSGPSSSASVSNEGDLHVSAYSPGIIPHFWSPINPTDCVKFGHQQFAVNQTASTPDNRETSGNRGEMGGRGRFANRMSADTTMQRLPLLNEGSRSQILWPTKSQIPSEDMV
jgi:hypothetical protein